MCSHQSANTGLVQDIARWAFSSQPPHTHCPLIPWNLLSRTGAWGISATARGSCWTPPSQMLSEGRAARGQHWLGSCLGQWSYIFAPSLITTAPVQPVLRPLPLSLDTSGFSPCLVSRASHSPHGSLHPILHSIKHPRKVSSLELSQTWTQPREPLAPQDLELGLVSVCFFFSSYYSRWFPCGRQRSPLGAKEDWVTRTMHSAHSSFRDLLTLWIDWWHPSNKWLLKTVASPFSCTDKVVEAREGKQLAKVTQQVTNLRLCSESRLSTTTLGCKQRSQASCSMVLCLSKSFLRRNWSRSLNISLSTLMFICVFTHSKTLWGKKLLSWRPLLISDPCYRTREENWDRGLTTWLSS